MASMRDTVKAILGTAWHVAHDSFFTTFLPATDGTVEANKPPVLDANKAVDVVRTASLRLGASGSETTITASGTEFNALAGATAANNTTGKAAILGTNGAQTIADGADVTLGTTTGTKIGATSQQKLGFFGATPVVQPTSANEAAASTASITVVVTTATTATSPVGFTTTAQANAIPTAINSLITQVGLLTTLANQLRADAVTVGLIKGS